MLNTPNLVQFEGKVIHKGPPGRDNIKQQGIGRKWPIFQFFKRLLTRLTTTSFENIMLILSEQGVT